MDAGCRAALPLAHWQDAARGERARDGGDRLPSDPLFGFATLAGAVGGPFFLASYIVSLTQTSFGGGLIGSKDELVT